jgi:hypothetical protein
MEVTQFIQEVLDEVCLDDRISNGMFDVQSINHLGILKEYATQMVDEEFAGALVDQIAPVEEGNFPERQAFNDDGILVTFPDEESKAAAISRGSHHETAPSGTQEPDAPDDSPDDSASTTSPSNASDGSDTGTDTGEDAEDTDKVEDLFIDFESPEDAIASREAGGVLDMMFGAEDIILRHGQDDDRPVEKEIVHVYDILDKVRESLLSDSIPDLSFDALVEAGDLHPTILFALKQKWEYDRGGNWYDETQKLRATTDRRGQLDPAKSKDRAEMLVWLDDYLKRSKASLD